MFGLMYAVLKVHDYMESNLRKYGSGGFFDYMDFIWIVFLENNFSDRCGTISVISIIRRDPGF